MEVERTGAPMDVRKILGTLWRRKWWVIVVVDLAIALSLFSTLRQDDQFAASAVARYSDPSSVSVFGGVTIGGIVNPERQAAAEEIAAQSPRVISLVQERLGERYGKVSSLDSSASADTQVVGFRATSGDPAVARDAATEFASAYVEVRRSSIEEAISGKAAELRRFAADTSAKIAELSDRISEIDTRIAGFDAGRAEDKAAASTLASQRALLVGQRENLTRSVEQSNTRADQFDIEATIQASASADVIQRASLPSAPFAPTPLQDAIVAGLIGLLIGVCLAFAREYFDDRTHTPEDVIAAAGDTVILGTIPLIQAKDGAVVLASPQSIEAEAYRAVRTSLQFRSLSGGARSLLVTSAMQQEGKTTTAGNLAASLAANGAVVIAVDFDLRRPRLADFFGVESPLGVTSLLLGETTLDEALREVPSKVGGRLFVLPAGSLPPNPAELLGSAVVGDLIQTLRDRADFVVIDTPPVLPISDALVASAWADGIILVSRIGTSGRRQLTQALDRLEQIESPVLGVVVNGAARTGKEYASTYYRAPEPVADAAPVVPARTPVPAGAEPPAASPVPEPVPAGGFAAASAPVATAAPAGVPERDAPEPPLVPLHLRAGGDGVAEPGGPPPQA